MGSTRSEILVRNTAWIYFGKILSQVLALIAVIFVLRELDVDVYGEFNILISILIVYNVFGVSPIVNVFARYIPEIIKKKQKTIFARLLLTGTGFAIIISFLISLLIYNFSEPFSKFFNIRNFEAHLTILMLFIFFSIIRILVQSSITSLLLHKHAALLQIISSLVRSGLLLISLNSLDVHKLLVIEALSALTFGLPGLIIIINKTIKLRESKARRIANPVTNKRILRFGIYSSLNELGAGIVGKSSDFFIISALSDMYSVGLYSFANRIFEIMFKLLPFKEFMTVLQPLFIQKFTGNYSKKEFVNIFNFMVKFMLPVYLLPTFFFIVLGKPIIEIVIDPKYLAAYAVTCIVLISNIVTAIYFPVSMIVRLKERMEIALMSKIVVIFSIAGGIMAMKYFGIIGVAVATLLGDFLKNWFMLILIKRKTDVIYKVKEYKNLVLIFLLVNPPFFILQDYINTLGILILASSIYALLNAFLLIKFHAFNNEEVLFLIKLEESTSYTRKAGRIIRKINQAGKLAS